MKPLLILAALTLATPLHAAGFKAPEGCTATAAWPTKVAPSHFSS